MLHKHKHTKWEFFAATMRWNNSYAECKELIEQYGAGGWELAGVNGNDGGNPEYREFFFKRPLSEVE